MCSECGDSSLRKQVGRENCEGRSGANSACPISRRGFLAAGGLGATAMAVQTALAAASPASAAVQSSAGSGLPPGKPLRVKPLLLYAIAQRQEKTSWRPYGGLKSRADVDQEAKRIDAELKKLAAQAEFPIDAAPASLVGSDAEAAEAAKTDSDAILLFASGGPVEWLDRIVASKKPCIMFVRHRSGPVYLWYEIVHWRYLRRNEDEMKPTGLAVDDVVVDDYADVLWRLRALYGLKNAKGTVCVALGGLQSYSGPGAKFGPVRAKEVWGYEIKEVPDAEVAKRLEKARSDPAVLQEAERLAAQLLAQPNVTLETERRHVVSTFVALHVIRGIMRELGATNLGVSNCMGSLIRLLDTPPCLATSILNDEGLTAFCHSDYTHTPPGVLMRWISGKPSFVCNSHIPHHGMISFAHCAAPRRMNGKDFEPVKIMTHFESDYGAATKIEYTKGQTVTCIIPNLTCTRWQGFRGKVIDSPSNDSCRSQVDVAIDGDWRRLLTDMQGFHTIVTYGDYLREVGYALKKVGMGWDNFSA